MERPADTAQTLSRGLDVLELLAAAKDDSAATAGSTTAGGLACPSPQLVSQYMAYREKVLAEASVARAASS